MPGPVDTAAQALLDDHRAQAGQPPARLDRLPLQQQALWRRRVLVVLLAFALARDELLDLRPADLPDWAASDAEVDDPRGR